MAAVIAIEGIVENGKVSLPADVRLPEHAKVYIVVPGSESLPLVRVASPRLANRAQASHFKLEFEDISEEH